MAEAPSQQWQQQAAEPLQAWANFWITPSLRPWSTIPRVPPARGEVSPWAHQTPCCGLEKRRDKPSSHPLS